MDSRRFYIKVYDFMVKDLKLKGYELVIYALVFSLADSDGMCYAKYSYICERTGCRANTVVRVLRNLQKSGLIDISESTVDKRRTVITLKSSAVDTSNRNNHGFWI